MTDQELSLINKKVHTDTHWIWTELAESLHPDRKANTPVWDRHLTSAPALWLHKGYIKASEQMEFKF